MEMRIKGSSRSMASDARAHVVTAMERHMRCDSVSTRQPYATKATSMP